MRKTSFFKVMLLVAATLFAGASLTSCGNDDDNKNNPETGGGDAPTPAPAPETLKVNVLYVTFTGGKTAEYTIVGIGGNANNPQSAEENRFTFFDGPCDIHLECNFKTGNGTGDIQLVDQRALDPETQALAHEYSMVYGQYNATKCRYEGGILYYHLEGSGKAQKNGSEETINCTFKADVKQTGTIHYPIGD